MRRGLDNRLGLNLRCRGCLENRNNVALEILDDRADFRVNSRTVQGR